MPVGNGTSDYHFNCFSEPFRGSVEMDNVCLVISDLAGTNYQGGQQNQVIERAVQSLPRKQTELSAIPVNPNDDELYHIPESVF